MRRGRTCRAWDNCINFNYQADTEEAWPKPKAVPYLKRVRLEREEKERVAAEVLAGRIAARSKLRVNSPAGDQDREIKRSRERDLKRSRD